MSRADISAGKAHVELYVKNSAFMRGMDQASKQLTSLGKDIAKLGVPFQALGAAILAPLAGTIKVASDMEEQMNKFTVVFGEMSESMKKWGDEAGSAMGRSSLQMTTFLGSIQDLLVPMGFAEDHARELSKRISTLAIDLASFNNLADEDVLRDLQSALTGSGQVMKKYGVIVSEARVQQQLFNEGLDPKEATEAQKAMARLTLILAGTEAAHGDAVRSAGSFANQMKALRAEVTNTSQAIGSILVPAVAGVMPKIRDVIKMVAEWAAGNETVVKTVAATGVALVAIGSTFTVLGGVIFGVGQTLSFFVAAITTATKAVTLAGAVFAALATPLGAISALVVGLTTIWLTMTQSGQRAAVGLMEAFADAKAFIGETVEAMFLTLTDGRIGLAAEIAAVSIEVAFIEAFARIKHAALSLVADLTTFFGRVPMSAADIGLMVGQSVGANIAGRQAGAATSEQQSYRSAQERRAALLEQAMGPAQARQAQQAAQARQQSLQADIMAHQSYRPTDGNALIMREYAAEQQSRMGDPTTHALLRQMIAEQRQSRAVYQ